MVQCSQLLLRQEESSEEIKQIFLQQIAENGKRATRLIDDLLKYAIIAQTEVRPTHAIRAGLACEEARSTLAAAIQASRAKVKCDLPENAQVCVELSRMTQVFQNLIGNAIHYRREHVAPVVDISAKPQGTRWQFAVRTMASVLKRDMCNGSLSHFAAYMGTKSQAAASG